MPTYKTEFINKKINNKDVTLIKLESFDNFNENILGLGKIGTTSNQINALSVMFDLEGFTNFCKQIDPQLAVPEFLNRFLKWLFTEIKNELINKKHKEGYETWADLPFLSKFMGDGILFLWNTKEMDDVEILNVVSTMYDICKKYKSTFFPEIEKNITAPPPKLRCGIARGAIYSVGNGNDFVGPCINMSARLQKLNSLSFCFSRRGINPTELGVLYEPLFITKKTNIRGIGDNELVCILKSEFDKLDRDEKKKFSN